MPCRKLNRRGYMTRPLHRLWCRTCRDSQDLDTMIGFGLVQMQDEPPSQIGLTQTLAALPLDAGGKAIRRAARRVGLRQFANMARVGLAGLCAFGAWGAYMNYTPPLHIPAKPVPAINAFDYFKRAGDQLVYHKEVDAALDSAWITGAQPTPPIHKLERDTTADSLNRNNQVWRVFDDKHLYTPADKQMLVDANRQALATLREGLKYPYVESYVRSSKSMFPYLSRYRQTARLLSLEAQTRAARGDWNGAMQSDLDSMEMGAKLPGGGTLMGRLVGIACEAIGRRNAWKALGHLDRTQTQAALARMQAIRAEHVPFTESVQEENWGSQSTAREIMADPNWRWHFESLWGGDDIYGNNPHFHLRALTLYGWSNRAILNDITAFNRETMRRTLLPYQAARVLPSRLEPADPVGELLFPVFEGARFRDLEGSETQDDLLLVTLALRLYALDNKGAYPDTLAQLTPRYLDHVPADLFTSHNAPLRYKKWPIHDNFYSGTAAWQQQEILRLERMKLPDYPGKDAYVLYSVGPDGKDDGGLPIDAKLRPAHPSQHTSSADVTRYFVNPEYKGDIVAGLNGVRADN